METRSQNPICPGGRKEDRKKNHHSIVLHLNSTLTLVGSTTKDSYPQRQLRKKKKKKRSYAQLTGLDSLAWKEALLDTKPR